MGCIGKDSLKNLRVNLASNEIEVAIINEQQFVIKWTTPITIEIIAAIPHRLNDLRERLRNGSLGVCSIDGKQKVVRRDGAMIEILSDIIPIDEVEK